MGPDLGWRHRDRWSGLVAFIAVDTDREKHDLAADRTHLTGTTFSCWLRRHVAKLGTHGPVLFRIGIDVSMTAFKDWFIPHIADHIDNRRAGL